MENTIFVTLYISPADAVRALNSQSGYLKVHLQKKDLESLTPEEREALARCPALNLSLNSSYLQHGALQGASTADFEGVRIGLANFLEKEAKAKQREEIARLEKEQKHQRAIQEIKETPFEDLLRKPWGEHFWEPSGVWKYYKEGGSYSNMTSEPELAELYARVQEEIDKRNAEEKKKREEQEKKEQAEKERREAQHKLYLEALDTFVEEHGAPDQKERLQHGVLPQKEKEQLVRDHLFSRFAGHKPYKKIRKTEVLCLTDDYDPIEEAVDFDRINLNELTSEQWVVLKKFMDKSEGKDPPMIFVCRKHQGLYRDEVKITRYSVKATCTWHGTEFHKTFALEPNEASLKSVD